MNKRGDIQDILVFLVVIFTLAIGLFIFAYIIPQIGTGLEDAGLNSSNEGANAITELKNFGTETVQRGFLLLFVGFAIATLISAFFVRTHPLFIFLYILVLSVTTFLAIYIGNAYQTFVNNPIFVETLASQTLMNAVMENIITIVIAIGVLSMIIVFSKFTSGGQGLGQRI